MRPLVLPAARWSRTPDELREDPAAVSSRAPPPSYPDHVHSPSLPPSNAAGGWPTQPPPTPAPTVLPSTNGPLKPWLGLRARLFLSLLSPSLLALIFVGATILMGTDDVDDKVNAAKQRLTSACASAEGSASAAMSLPRYLADRANAQTAESIEATVRGVGRVLDLSLTAIERLLVFLVDSYRSLFLCFIELLVRGSLSLLIAAITALNEGVHAIAGGLKDALQSSVSGVNSFLSATLGGINDVIGVFGQHVNVPTIQPPDLAALDNVSLPTSFDEGLRRLNSSLPTLSELRAKVDGMISGPFEQLRAEVNTTVSAFQFDRSLMPLPEARIASFCADIDMQPLDDLAHDLRKLAYWATAIIAFIALAFALLTMAMEWWSWRSLRRHVENTRDAWIAADGFPSTMSGSTNRDSKTSTLTGSPEAAARYRGVLSTPSLFSLLQLSSHPLLSLLTFRLAKPLGIRSSEAKARLRWWLAWISHPIAVAALIIGTVGLASSQLQILALRGVQERYEGKIDGSFTTMGDKVLAQLNRGLTDASHDFANRSNEMIIGAQNGLNDNLFAWVNATTSTMNHTLNEMIEGIAGALNDSFASTPLYTPVQGFIDCALLSKLRSIEQALTWLQTNAHVEFERISPDILQLSHARSDELVAPIKQAALGSQQDHNDGVVGGIVSSYIKHLHHQQILYLVFVGLYCLAWIAGTCIVLAHSTKGVGRNHAYPKSGITPYPFTLHEPPSPAYEERADDRDGSVRGHHSITPPLHPDVVAQLQNSRSATCGPGELADAGGQYWRRDQSHQPSALDSLRAMVLAEITIGCAKNDGEQAKCQLYLVVSSTRGRSASRLWRTEPIKLLH
ncbi:hypothetical protein IE81DRAFT_99426 [Ceraceosorus guamensis]|uniref:Plasma membrane fusion protein PRM1 n=1 Tax=Ceraceosorus guamensis TaxID=1522189 RepID=A0A316W0H7_9BASI|nr:hypothetical protein IE81DRAFT_99426 [Ceraceosorus guamensis]PWN43189.1 hypothetical protein IE81DRAFT_99426 [Ceraceosorus guamensis]